MASKNNVQRIILAKTCSIDGVADLTKQVIDALAKSNRLEFDLSGVAEMELPVIQVLYAAAQSATSSGGGAILVGPIQESVMARLVKSGFSRNLVKDGQALQSRLPGFSGIGVPS